MGGGGASMVRVARCTAWLRSVLVALTVDNLQVTVLVSRTLDHPCGHLPLGRPMSTHHPMSRPMEREGEGEDHRQPRDDPGDAEGEGGSTHGRNTPANGNGDDRDDP